MAASLADLNDQIQQLQRQFTQLQAQRDSIQSALTFVNANRPAGIPPSWKARFDGTPPNVTIYAWFDPNKYGDRDAI